MRRLLKNELHLTGSELQSIDRLVGLSDYSYDSVGSVDNIISLVGKLDIGHQVSLRRLDDGTLEITVNASSIHECKICSNSMRVRLKHLPNNIDMSASYSLGYYTEKERITGYLDNNGLRYYNLHGEELFEVKLRDFFSLVKNSKYYDVTNPCDVALVGNVIFNTLARDDKSLDAALKNEMRIN